jgi:hypothetical protein
VRALRRHVIVRVFVCLLLAWAAADMFVPEVCNAESVAATSGSATSSVDHDDCFCCCSHTEGPPLIVVMVSDGAPVVIVRLPVSDLAAGVPPSLYRPPLS